MRMFRALLLLALLCPALSAADGSGKNNGPAIAVPGSGILSSLPPESVSLSTGETKKFDAPFVIETAKADTSNVRVTLVSERTFEVEGISPGNAVVRISVSGLSKEYRVTVTSSILPVYRELCRELSDLPEVGIELADNVLTLRGEIMREAHWEIFRQVIKRHEEDCRNFVTFQPAPALFTQLKKQMEEAGYKVVDKISPDQPGCLQFELVPGVLTVSGYLLCENDIAAVQRILASRKWLSPNWNGNAFRAETDLRVSDTQLDVGIVFVGVTKTQLKRLGNNMADGTVLTWNLIAWFRALAGGAPEGITNAANGEGAYSYLNTNLKGSLVFFGKNGISDFRDAGHLTLSSNRGVPATYENGGTLNVKVTGQDVADLKSIDFGLKLTVQGGLIRSNVVRLSIEAEKSLAPVKQDEDYFQRKTKTITEIVCPLGETAVIAGQRELSYSDSGPTGYAFLRHIPGLSWFASSSENQGEELQILILVYPQIAGRQVQLAMPPSAETAQVEQDITKTVRARNDREQKEEKYGWFRKMFTW